MKTDFANSLELLLQAETVDLYQKLLLQLKKDFGLANIDLAIENPMTPRDLKMLLQEKVYFLLMERFTDYLNLLYVVDVPEKQIKSITSHDVVEVSEQVCFLILKREWQKVWLKRQYSA